MRELLVAGALAAAWLATSPAAAGQTPISTDTAAGQTAGPGPAGRERDGGAEAAAVRR